MQQALIPFIFLSLSFFNFSKATNVTGFEFKDNQGTKYVTDDNGVAEIKIKESFMKPRVP